MSHDRSETDDLKLTQEFLAIMLGANRSSVTMSAIAAKRRIYQIRARSDYHDRLRRTRGFYLQLLRVG